MRESPGALENWGLRDPLDHRAREPSVLRWLPEQKLAQALLPLARPLHPVILECPSGGAATGTARTESRAWGEVSPENPKTTTPGPVIRCH